MGFCGVTKGTFFNKVYYKRVHINFWSLSSLHFLIFVCFQRTHLSGEDPQGLEMLEEYFLFIDVY